MGALEEPDWRRASDGDLGQAGAGERRGAFRRAARQKYVFGKRPQKDATEANEIAQGERVPGAPKETREEWRWVSETAAPPSPSQGRREGGGEEVCNYLRRLRAGWGRGGWRTRNTHQKMVPNFMLLQSSEKSSKRTLSVSWKRLSSSS